MKNEYTINWQFLKDWVNEHRFRGVRLVLFFLYCAFLGAAIYLCARFIFYDQWRTALLYFLIIWVCAYFAFFRDLMIARQNYKFLSKNYGKEAWLRTISFEDDGIVIAEGNGQATYAYTNIVRVIENGDKVDLITQAKGIIRLYKSKFVGGTWEECKAKIVENNTDVKIREK